MATDLDEQLGRFHEKAITVRLVRTVCNVVPFAPALPDWYSLVDGLRHLDEGAKRPVLERAAAIGRSADAQRALWMVQALDAADGGLGVFSGVRSAVALYQAESGAQRLDALETDTQQAIDAVVKCLVIGFLVHRLFEGSVAEKVGEFRQTETGQALLFYLAAVEVGLPFADDAAKGGGALLTELLDRFGEDQVTKLAAVASPEEASGALATVRAMVEPLQALVATAAAHLSSIADASRGVLGSAIEVGDKVAGVAATGADLLPVYRFLGTRLVAEVALRRAIAEDRADRAEAEGRSAAAVPVRYTRSADDLPEAPARRRGCFGLFLLLLIAGSATLPSIVWLVSGPWGA